MKTFIFSLLLAFPFNTYAFTINPARLELGPTGKATSGVIQVVNDSNEEAPVQIYMMERTADEFGKELRKEFDIKKKFLILPSNLTLKPKSSASVRVVYIGEKGIENELGYRLIFAGANPKPLSRMKKDGISASVDVLLSYAASVWVTPQDGKPRVTFTGVKSLNGKSYIALKNEGKRRSFVPNGTLVMSDAKNKTGEKHPVRLFKELEEPIMSGQTRLVEIPASVKLDHKTLKVEFGE